MKKIALYIFICFPLLCKGANDIISIDDFVNLAFTYSNDYEIYKIQKEINAQIAADKEKKQKEREEEAEKALKKKREQQAKLLAEKNKKREEDLQNKLLEQEQKNKEKEEKEKQKLEEMIKQ